MKTIADIFPLTIIKMRFGGKYIIFESEIECNRTAMEALQTEEECYYNYLQYLEDNCFCKYGVGDTIDNAVIDFFYRN